MKTATAGRLGRPGIRGTERQEKIRQVLGDKAGDAAAIVARWEGAAREAGRWDETYPADLLESLMKLDPENLLAAGEASSYQAMMTVLATGQAEPKVEGPVPSSLGSLGGQGGSATGCGIPLAVAQAVTMTIVAVQPARRGYLAAWGLGERPMPSSVLNYAANDVVANTAIVPVVPGGGDDFTLFSLASTHAVVDVLGYFAASSATRLDCMTVSSDAVSVPVDELTAVDATCPAGRTATGGGCDTAEGTIAFPGLFMTSTPLANGWRTVVENHTGGPRGIQTFARCCRIPGR